eukprot:RCo018041
MWKHYHVYHNLPGAAVNTYFCLFLSLGVLCFLFYACRVSHRTTAWPSCIHGFPCICDSVTLPLPVCTVTSLPRCVSFAGSSLCHPYTRFSPSGPFPERSPQCLGLLACLGGQPELGAVLGLDRCPPSLVWAWDVTWSPQPFLQPHTLFLCLLATTFPRTSLPVFHFAVGFPYSLFKTPPLHISSPPLPSLPPFESRHFFFLWRAMG